MTETRQRLGSTLLALALLAGAAAGTRAAEPIPVSELKERTHIHGLAVDRASPGHLLIATHHGLFRAAADGQAELISPVQDFMGFTPDPANASRLYASGHPAGGGNLGFIASADNGATWTQISPGVDGPVDFHQMTVSPADPDVVYGAYGALQVSRDAGRTWSVAGPLPDRLIDLAASGQSADKLYAATEVGLFVSEDGGQGWKAVIDGAPVSLVEVTSDGVHAFVVGRGLVRSPETELEFETVSDEWGDGILLHLAADASEPDRLFAASQQGDIFASADGGKSWTKFGE